MSTPKPDITRHRVSGDRLDRQTGILGALREWESSDDVPEPDSFIGQDRAVHSVRFGLRMEQSGYNIFVVGPPGTGRQTLIEDLLEEEAGSQPVPPDWCYIFNFADPDRPLAVALAAGEGKIFQKDMEELLSRLKLELPKAYDSREFEQEKSDIVQDAQQKIQNEFRSLEEAARSFNFEVRRTPEGFNLIPMIDGEPIRPSVYQELDEAQKEALEKSGSKLRSRLDRSFREIQQFEKEARGQISDLEKRIPRQIAAPQVEQFKEKYHSHPRIQRYLDQWLQDAIDKNELFTSEAAEATEETLRSAGDPFARYQVNLFVNNEGLRGAPVVFEASPTFYNLHGKIEYRNQMMALGTNFLMVKPGALARANGGYLILQLKDILGDPFSWDALKRALNYREIMIENMGEQYRYVPTVSLSPEPIPLRCKVILLASPVFYQLYAIDEDFARLFKVRAEFVSDMPRSDETIRQYATFIRSQTHKENLLPFSREAMARVIGHGSRMAGDGTRLSTHFNELSEVIYEASELARESGAKRVEAGDVSEALRLREYRVGTIEEKMQEQIQREIVRIQTSGSEVGQINGLSVVMTGNYLFGQPSRITAVTYPGRAGIINIERETEMSGSVHSKGVLTLSGYLGHTLALEEPLGFTAQITFEQNYGGVEGDSASAAELFAVLSSLSDLPLRQGIAVTGSVDQHGNLQPIGGVTQKVEGFFRICRHRGLDGTQGVLIPEQNIEHLTLRDEVLGAIREEQFHLYAIRTASEGIEVMTGHPAGERGPDGRYPEDSVYGLASRKLGRYNDALSRRNQQQDSGAGE